MNSCPELREGERFSDEPTEPARLVPPAVLYEDGAHGVGVISVVVIGVVVSVGGRGA